MIMTSGNDIILCPLAECSPDPTPQPLLAPLCLFTMTLPPESWSMPSHLLNKLINTLNNASFNFQILLSA